MPLTLAVLVVLGFFAHFAWLLAAVVLVAMVARFIRSRSARHDVEAIAERRRIPEFCERADQQHQQFLTGDEFGFYGSYPPAV